MIMAIDPGRGKCGIAVIDKSREAKFHRIIETSEFTAIISELISNFDIEIIILGSGTSSKDAKNKITAISDLPVKVVDEHHTTEEARKLYWKRNPPSGWRKIIPTSMQVPPVPVDDLAAEILALRFLEMSK